MSVTKETAIKALEKEMTQIVKLQYDTSVPLSELQDKVAPFLGDEVGFTDPWQAGRGKARYELGMRGFHNMFYFDFEVLQLRVDLNDAMTRARVIVDGYMNLRQLQIYTYPLRTILVYHLFVNVNSGEIRFWITDHEEMWSFGDMIENLPIVGHLYNLFRATFARGFLFASSLSCAYQETKKHIFKELFAK